KSSGRICAARVSASAKLCATSTRWSGANLRSAEEIATASALYSSTRRMPRGRLSKLVIGGGKGTLGTERATENRRRRAHVNATRSQVACLEANWLGRQAYS